MTYRCERCGQTALETDTVCWHCGWRFPQQEPKKAPSKVKATTAEDEPLQLSAIAIYSLLALATLIAIVLVVRSLNQKPFFLTSPETSLPPGWVPVTDQEQQFTLNLPAEWRSTEQQNGEEENNLPTLVANHHLQAAAAPLAGTDANTEVLLIAANVGPATNTVPPGFLLVARSAVLRQLSAEQTLNLARQNASNLLEAVVSESFTGQDQVTLLFDIENDDSFRCQERLVPGQQATYLVAGCTPAAGYPRYRDELKAIVTSFQPLAR